MLVSKPKKDIIISKNILLCTTEETKSYNFAQLGGDGSII